MKTETFYVMDGDELEQLAVKHYRVTNYSFCGTQEGENGGNYSFETDPDVLEDEPEYVEDIRAGKVHSYCNNILQLYW